MREFLARGFEVFATSPPGSPEARLAIESLGAVFIPWDIQKAGRNPLGELLSILALVGIVRRVRPDTVFCYTIKPVIYGTIISWLTGVPRRVAMITGLGYAFLPGGGLTRTLVRPIVRLGYRAALLVTSLAIFQNNDDIALFLKLKLLRPSTPTSRVLGDGVDLDHFKYRAPPMEGPVFLFVGRLLRDKGLYEFVESARRVRLEIPESRFVVVGSSDTNPAAVSDADLAAWIKEGVIEHRGFLSDPKPEYETCNIFVLPSYREGLPRTNVEAMAIGRAIITTDVPGCSDTVVGGVTGLLVPARDADALTKAMLTLARDLERAEDMGKNGRALCEQRFGLTTVTRTTADLIEGLPVEEPSM